ncbi:ADP-ribosylglycohydrolase family protein [uncultured Methanobrevibacter sp.]|uniref:ADP-ribosylglycohydrolase family protein n=1 Tax=uncultured Methanobrevibacter sp. TaxID=253161 RepID=UPI0026373349|nr:ADP-ribosylglycohydrolase family protein [uncultured Methanobrevibacter sp.]
MKIKDGICGFIIGDALGVPVEFTSRETLQKNPVKMMKGYGTYNMPPGTFSDDTSMTLATMNSICNKKAIDFEDIQSEFSEWLFNDKYTQYGTFDYGETTFNSLSKFKDGFKALNCGGTGEMDNGNGSLMRILPLAFIPDINYETIENVSALTHAHLRSKIACVLYVEIAKSMFSSDLTIKEHIKIASDKVKKYYNNSNELKHFKRIFNDDLNKDIKSSGYVIDTLESVIYCLKTTDNYKDSVLKAVNLGEDTDTIAAICGGLSGIYYGFDSIPIDWLNQIEKINNVITLCEKYEGVINEYWKNY